MANVFITNYCNLRCKYCFARGMLGDSHSNELTLEEVDKVKDIIGHSHHINEPERNIISILGGEPTQHSNFIKIIDHLVNSGFIVKLFTNGTFTSEICDYMYKIPQGKINLIFNINKKEDHTSDNWKKIEYNLLKLHNIITLGLTIADINFDYQAIIEHVNKHKLKRDLRLGISMPIVNADNKYIRFKEYKQIGNRIVEFSEAALKENMTLGFDCGFVMCMFTRKQLGALQLNNVAMNFKCDGAIDIGKNGRVWRCFPLYSIHNTSLDKFNSITAIKDYYNNLLPKKDKGISGKCGICKYYSRNICSGGCYGYEFI